MDSRIIDMIPVLLRAQDGKSAVELGRALAKAFKLNRNPVGAANAKTGVPNTYRPVGPTCPQTCPYGEHGDGSCYATGGNVRLHAARSSADVEPGIVAAVIAMTSAVADGTVARLHVSGDLFAPDGSLDVAYCAALCEAADAVRSAADERGIATSRWLAWTYTHGSREELGIWALMLQSAGISVVWSDSEDKGGAIVMPHDMIPAHKARIKAETGARLVACPAQTRGITCKTCQICPNASARGVVVAFDPHGSKGAQLEAAKREALA